MTTLPSKTSSSTDSSSPDCSSFLNWNGKKLGSKAEKTVVFRSLVATVKFQHDLDVSLEAKAVKFLKSVDPKTRLSANDFLIGLGTTTANSSRIFVQSIAVLLSSPNQSITIAAMKMLVNLIWLCTPKVLLALVEADLIPQLIITLTPQSLAFEEAEDIHINLMESIRLSLWLVTPNDLRRLGIADGNEQQAVRKTILKQVVVPSEMYISHLCVNLFSIVYDAQSKYFLELLETSPYYQPTMNFVLHMPVILTIPSCLTFFESDNSICSFLRSMIDAQREWNKQREEVRKKGKTVHRMLRMEGFEDVFEEKLQNDKNEFYGTTMRFPGYMFNDLGGIIASLVPTPRCHFMMTSYTPLASQNAQQAIRKTSVHDVMRRLIEPQNLMVSCSRDKGVYASILNIIQPGSANSSDIDQAAIHKTLQQLRAKQRVKFVPWCPASIQVAVAKRSPFIEQSSRVSGLMLANHTSINTMFERTLRQFWTMLKSKAYLFKYAESKVIKGNENEFEECGNAVTSLISEYREMEKESYGSLSPM
ncbi:putative Tubulin gamma chain [Blattamonas nauphoetae]|uniref:Tubulin gamma chain n=1 Tax=Blattamonas nauphoetae TaxID=2049346 RepID=A0ABQ9XRF7_9EUKA|nr:putative Tubulin gamma chain [Blattamonas nauphoetae]